MKTHIITKDQLDADNKYVGSVLLTNFDGSLEIEANLGWVRFAKMLSVSGSIFAKAGSGIKAGEGIEAGEGISVRLRIFAGTMIYRQPEVEEMTVKCKRLLSGTVAYGTLLESNPMLS